jgi:DNA-binding transcriptional LysR family regulator
LVLQLTNKQAMHLDDLQLFVRVAELGTLSAAAREINAPVSQVTRALTRLEAALGARLMHRSTHGLSLTDEGDACLAQARRMLELRDTLHAELAPRLSQARGWVRVGASALMAQAVIAPSLPSLYIHHPDLHIDLSTDDRVVDMAREGIDVALRTGDVHGEHLVARQIGVASRSLYAAPTYLAQHGHPQHPADLARHHLITLSHTPNMNLWPHSDGQPPLLAQGSTRVDQTSVLLSLVLQGVGISRLLDAAARPLVANGSLVPILPGQFASEAIPIYAVMLKERHRLPKVRACVTHWQDWLAAN